MGQALETQTPSQSHMLAGAAERNGERLIGLLV